MKLLIFDGVGGVKSQQQGMENLVTGYKIHFCRSVVVNVILDLSIFLAKKRDYGARRNSNPN